MEEKLTGNELEMLYAAADYRRAEIVMNQYFDKVPGNAGNMSDNSVFLCNRYRRIPLRHENEFHHPAR